VVDCDGLDYNYLSITFTWIHNFFSTIHDLSSE